MKVSYQDRLNQFKKGWGHGIKGRSECGSGSDDNMTGHIIKWIPEIAAKYNLNVINDSGAGDLKWASKIEWADGVDYQGYDVVQRHDDVIELDTTKELMRPSDVVLCRQVMIHLSVENVLDMLKLIKQTSKYLMATNYHSPMVHKSDDDALFWHIRLTDPIFELGEPIENTIDTNHMNDLALWKL